MKHTEESISNIKQMVSDMWRLVESQIRKAQEAMLNHNVEQANEVMAREKKVNSYELSIDMACENFIALFNPVAIDLRFVLSLMKINNNLERMGDFADGIARFVTMNQSGPLPEDLVRDLKLTDMFREVNGMIDLCREALVKEDSRMASKVFAKDAAVDRINIDSVAVLAGYAAKNKNANPEELFHLYAAIRRLERIGDRCSNIAEDIVFFVDARELRHIGEQKGKK